ncbi:conserved hypothetical protein [Alteracholeplasma palmae J233]|uniref:DUF1294 domain-containing protein n=1 Tax=Alteracholeplasma palmae (strain ATCC 49389 / J233) TaxID=1318466 RepID=U4KL38_ALTPJ|nr:DUF1294 domain-containing protein [Alteracholeplasma palmae]CCV64589.1 conserved hypothetical protein [Alteracholeplasma palmae J233]
MEIVVIGYIILWFLLSIFTYILYRNDKKKSIKGKWRTKEKTLLLASFLLGSIGGLLALYKLRHKNKHWYFKWVNWLSFILHLGILGLLVYLTYK